MSDSQVTPAGVSIENDVADIAIRQMIASQVEAWNSHDARAWSLPFAEQAGFVNIRGISMSGRAEIEATHARIFSGIYAGSHSTVTVHRITMLGTDTAIAETEHRVAGYAALPPGVVPTDESKVLRTRMTYVLRRSEALEWKIVHGHNTAILPTLPRRP